MSEAKTRNPSIRGLISNHRANFENTYRLQTMLVCVDFSMNRHCIFKARILKTFFLVLRRRDDVSLVPSLSQCFQTCSNFSGDCLATNPCNHWEHTSEIRTICSRPRPSRFLGVYCISGIEFPMSSRGQTLTWGSLRNAIAKSELIGNFKDMLCFQPNPFVLIMCMLYVN